jgi:hypothetical protein
MVVNDSRLRRSNSWGCILTGQFSIKKSANLHLAKYDFDFRQGRLAGNVCEAIKQRGGYNSNTMQTEEIEVISEISEIEILLPSVIPSMTWTDYRKSMAEVVGES